MKRKQALKNLAALGAVPMIAPYFSTKAGELKSPLELKGNIKHSVCRWCYQDIPLEEFCEKVAAIGLKSVELLTEKEWPVAQQYGLTCAMATYPNASLTEGFNHTNNHEQLQAIYKPLIPKVADAGLPNLICFSGNTNALTDAEGIENCAVGLAPLVRLAEKHGVVICMELFNTKVDHPGYQCASTAWGTALVDKIGSPNFKLLYDIYHMQIMEGDIIATIRKYGDYFAHYHTAGVPGRHEIDDQQELNYKAIMQAIVDTGFSGYVAQEFIPTMANPLTALAQGVTICDV